MFTEGIQAVYKLYTGCMQGVHRECTAAIQWDTGGTRAVDRRYAGGIQKVYKGFQEV